MQIEWPNVSSNKFIVCKPEINYILVKSNENSTRLSDPFAEDATESDITTLSEKTESKLVIEEDDRGSELSFRSEETDLILSSGQ